MDDPVPAIPEWSATGEVATIFADIREVLGVGVVNLIWRHLATIEGALPWAWSALRPLYIDGTIAREATALHAELDLQRMPKMPLEAFAVLGLTADDRIAIRSVLSAYNRTNAMAQIAFSALLCRLTGNEAPEATDAPQSLAPGESWTSIPLPALPSLADLPTEAAALVVTLNGIGTKRPVPILASMYRHLAHWPAFLALSWAVVAPLETDGRLERWIQDGQQKAQRRALRCAGNLAVPPPDQKLIDAMRVAIEPFAGDVITKMVVICALLRSMMCDP